MHTADIKTGVLKYCESAPSVLGIALKFAVPAVALPRRVVLLSFEGPDRSRRSGIFRRVSHNSRVPSLRTAVSSI